MSGQSWRRGRIYYEFHYLHANDWWITDYEAYYNQATATLNID